MIDMIKWLNERMKNQHMTNSELADRADCTEQQVSLWRRYKTKPRWEQMVRLVEAFGYHFEIVANDEKIKQDMDLYEVAHQHGFQYGYQTAIKDMGKKMKEMRTYGGYKNKRAEGMPGVRKGSVEADQR